MNEFKSENFNIAYTTPFLISETSIKLMKTAYSKNHGTCLGHFHANI